MKDFLTGNSIRIGSYPGSVDRVSRDPNQFPDILDFDKTSDTLPGITVKDGWAYFKVPFLWLSEDCYDDFNFNGAALGSGSTEPSKITLFGSGGIKGYAFNGNTATVDELHGGGELIHSYKEGATLHAHVHWVPTTADAGDVKWGFEYSVQNVNGTFAAPEIVYAIQAAGGTAWVHKKADFTDIVGTGLEIGAQIYFRLFRNPADVDDTYGANAGLLSVGVHVLHDSVGSRSLTTK